VNDRDPSSSDIELVRSLAEIPLDEREYKADLEVASDYQKFSAELLRISLLAIGVFGFLLKEGVLNEKVSPQYRDAFISAKYWFISGLVVLVFAAAFALAHRFVSSDCIATQIRYLRLKHARDEALKDQGERDTGINRNSEMQSEKKDLEIRLKAGGYTLGAATVTLAIGIALIAIGFSVTIFSTKATSPSEPAQTEAINK